MVPRSSLIVLKISTIYNCDCCLQQASERASVCKVSREMAVQIGTEGRNNVDITGDTKTKEDQRKEEKYADDVDVGSIDGSIDKEVQEALVGDFC